jgi:hypothetical protein
MLMKKGTEISAESGCALTALVFRMGAHRPAPGTSHADVA